MPGNDEKLKNFENVVMTQAALQRDKILKELAKEKDNAILQNKEKIKKQAAEILNRQLKASERNANDMISRAIIDTKKMLSTKREEIIDGIFAEIEAKLKNFVKTPEYNKYLLSELSKMDFSDKNKIDIYFTENDFEFTSKSGLVPEEASMYRASADIIGGFIAVNRATGVYSDKSLRAGIEIEKNEFINKCSLRID